MKIITFSTRDEIDSPLVKSCQRENLKYINLCRSDYWPSNGFKLYLLFNYLRDLPNEIVCITDAFDVEIYDSEEVIIKKFLEQHCDILFSAEANFYFKNKALKATYLQKYPPGINHYRFLNSGTYIGYSQSIYNFLLAGFKLNKISHTTIDSFLALRSDQYLLSKTFVDLLESGNHDIISKLDYKQELFACSGGRTTFWNFPTISSKQNLYYYRAEHKLLKKMNIAGGERKIRDLKFDPSGQLINVYTQTRPSLIHLPGTGELFEKKIKILKSSKSNSLSVRTAFLTFFICSLAYVTSIFKSIFSPY
jgi:hypothetical protein